MGDVLLEYRYDRSFIDVDLDNAVKIDTQVRMLLHYFRNSLTDDGQTHKGGLCK